MIAKSVGGVAVVAARAARADRGAVARTDDTSEIRGVAQLELADGRIVFACTVCSGDPYTDGSLRAVVSHMGGKHPGESVRAETEGRSVVAQGVTLRDAIRAVALTRRLATQNATLRARAVRAEDEVKRLRKAVRELARAAAK
jgi:hypothetical protein